MYVYYYDFFPSFFELFQEIFDYVKLSVSYIWQYLWGIFPIRLLTIGILVFFLIYFFINLLNRSKVD